MTGRIDEPFSLSGRRVWVSGHRGMVGSAICRRLQSEDCEIICCDRSEVDLRRQKETEDWIAEEKPDVVFHSAGTVGGIHAKSRTLAFANVAAGDKESVRRGDPIALFRRQSIEFFICSRGRAVNARPLTFSDVLGAIAERLIDVED